MKKLLLITLIMTILPSLPLRAEVAGVEQAKWAEVIAVRPVIRNAATPEQCRSMPVRDAHPPSSRHSPAGIIAGSIIGGVIGHNISHHRGAGAIAGALIGASIVGQSMANPQPAYPKRKTRYQNSCQRLNNSSYQDEIISYDVWYRYQGQEYKARMAHHPGAKIRVRTRVEPY